MTTLTNEIPDSALYDKETAERFNLVAQQRKTPLLLQGIFVELARQFYSDSENLPIEVKHVWSPDVKETKIWIDTAYRWEDETVEFRPAIYIKLGPIQYTSLTGRHDGLSGIDIENAEWHFSRSGTGRVSWVHIANRSGEAAALMGSTLDYFDAFSMVIRDDFCFTYFNIIQCIPHAGDRNDESYPKNSSVVTAEFQFQDTWRLKMESQKLKEVVFRAGLAAADGV